MESKANKNKKIAKMVALLVVLTGLQSGTVLAAKKMYDAFFDRYEKKDIASIYGEFDYSRVEDKLERVLVNFESDKAMLQGYYFPCNDAKGLVVVSHGMHAGADDYLPFIMYFVKNGYAVFSYDCKGTYASQGDSTVGMCTPLVDLDYALRFIKNDKRFSSYPLFLFGHSWGGYAATSVLSLHKDVKACAAVAPFNDGYTLIGEKGDEYTGPFSDLLTGGFPKIFLSVYQKILFKGYADLNSVKGINCLDIPVFIAHGEEDMVISFDGQSVISHRNEIREEGVAYYVGKGVHSGHNTILHSERAVNYQKQIKKELKELKKKKGDELTQKELLDFCNSIDHALYSEVNEELMKNIVEMFDKTL